MTHGIIEDNATGLYYGLQSEFPHQYDFVATLNEGSKAPWNEDGDEFSTSKVTQVYARWCIASCEWHDSGGFWHIEHSPGRGRTKAWQYGDI